MAGLTARVSGMVASFWQQRHSAVGKDFVYTFLGRVAVALVGLLSTRVLRESLGPDLMGLYATALSVQGFVLALADVGLSTSTTRLGAEFLASDRGLADTFFAWTHQVRLRIVYVILLLSGPAAPILAWLMLGDVHKWYIMLIPILGLVPISYLRSTHQAVLLAEKRFLASSLWNVWLALALLLSFVAFWAASRLDVTTALLAQVISSLITYPALTRMVRIAKIDARTAREQIQHRWQDIQRVTIPQAVCGIVSALDLPLSYALMTRLTKPQEAGLFYGAVLVAMPLRFFTETISSVLLPRAASMTGDPDRIIGYIRSVVRMTPLALITTGVVSAFLPVLVSLVLGDKFHGSLTVAWVLMAAYAPGVVFNALILLLFPLKMEREQMWYHLSVFTVQLLLRLVLIPPYGAVGNAVVLLAARVLAWPAILLLLHHGIRRLRAAQAEAPEPS